MKHYKDVIIHGAELFRHLQGQQQASDTTKELNLAQLPLAASRTAVRALATSSKRRAADGDENEDEDFFSSFAFGSGSGSGNDESGGDFDFMSAFGGGGFGGGGGDDESGAGGGFDFLSAIMGGGLGGGDGGEDNEEGDDPAFVGEVMENMEKCGIDVGDMMMKALGAFMMSGGAEDMDFSNPTESFEAFAPILLALKDDDEVECEGDDIAKVLVASEEYIQCSGMNDFMDLIQQEDYTTLMQTIESDCKPIMDMAMDMAGAEDSSGLEDFLNEESEIVESGNRCLQILLGDNSMGNFIRYQYNHIDKTFGCFSKLGEDLPHCVVSSPIPMDGNTYSFPLSLSKKLACVLGSSFESVLGEACVDTYEGLGQCLPQLDETDVDDATSLCAEEGGLLLGKQEFIGMDASVVTGNKLPDFCTKIFEGKGMDTKEVQSRLDHYNENREYGWTLETIANDAKESSIEAEAAPEEPSVEAEAVPDESSEDFIKSMESSEQPQESYKSRHVDIPSVESLEWEDGEAPTTASDDASARAKFFPFLMAGLIIVGVLALALIVKYARSRLGAIPMGSKSASRTNVSRKNYAHVAVKMVDNEIL